MQDKLFIAIRNKYREFATEIYPENYHVVFEIDESEYNLWVNENSWIKSVHFHLATSNKGEVMSRNFTEKDDTEVILKELDRAIKFLKRE